MQVTYVITKSVFGGAQRYVLDLATYGKEKDHEVSVVVGGSGTLIDKLNDRGIRVSKLQYLKRDIGLSEEIRALKDLYAIFKKEKPDVIHVNSSKVGGLGAVAGRLAGVKKIVFTAHGWPFNDPRALWARCLIWFFSWLTALFAHHTIVLTNHDHRQAKKMPFIKNKVTLIPNGVESFALETREVAREKLGKGLNRNGLWIGFVGELHNLNKGVNYLIEAFATVSKKRKDVTLVVVGEGEDRKALESSVVSLGLKDKVLFAGHVDNIRSLLPAFDIFTLPSLKEGLPYVLLEAGVAGLPTVASEIGGIPDIIENQKSGILVKPKDPKNLASKLLEALENTNGCKTMGECLRKNILNKFSLRKMQERTYSIYGQI